MPQRILLFQKEQEVLSQNKKKKVFILAWNTMTASFSFPGRPGPLSHFVYIVPRVIFLKCKYGHITALPDIRTWSSIWDNVRIF